MGSRTDRQHRQNDAPKAQRIESGAIDLVQLTDFHLFADDDALLYGVRTQRTLEAVLESVRARSPRIDLVLATGDLAHDGSAATYRRIHRMLDGLGCPVYWLPGNHDAPQVMGRCLHGGNVHPERCVRHAGWQIVLLDTTVAGSAGGRLSAAELEWLERCLEANFALPTLVCLHHQPVPVGCPWMDAMGVAESEAFFEILDRHSQVRAVLWGHVHQEFRGSRGGVELIGSPSTCFQFRPGSATFALDTYPPAYRWLRLAPDGRIATGIEWVQATRKATPER